MRIKPIVTATLLAALAVASAAPGATAGIIDWTFENINTNNGQPLVAGSFSVDTTTGAITTWDLTTPGGAGQTYTPADGFILGSGNIASGLGYDGVQFSTGNIAISIDFAVVFAFQNALTSPGTDPIGSPFITPGGLAAYETDGIDFFGDITGDVVGTLEPTNTISEPASFAVLGMALAGLAAMRRQRAR
jgi:hypothetical protein